MLELDQRVAAGLRELVARAPVEADVWLAAQRYVNRRKRQRRSVAGGVMAVALVTGAFVGIAVVRGGETKPGVSEPSTTSEPLTALPATGPVEGAFTITSTGDLTFVPDKLTVTTGIYSVTLEDGSESPHRLDFDDSSTMFAGLQVNEVGQMKTTRVFFGHPGDYTFFCAIPGHREPGERGAVHVIGPELTFAQAVAAGV